MLIWLLLALKIILSFWLWAKKFKYSSILLAVNFCCDVINLSTQSYLIGMISFILIPHLLISFLAEIYNSKYLRCVNAVSVILLMTTFLKYQITMADCLNYFLPYVLVTLLILNKSFLQIKKETFPLLTALIVQIFEIIAYRISYSNYKIVNILNGIYYSGLVIYLWRITINNTPILDDSPSFETKSLQVLKSNKAAQQSQPAFKRAA